MLETPLWAYHERSLAWVGLCLVVLLGVLVLMPTLMRFAIQQRRRLRPPSRLERRLERWLGL